LFGAVAITPQTYLTVVFPTRFATFVDNLSFIQARSQDCQNEEADRSSAPCPALPSLPSPPLTCGPLKSS